MKHRNHVAPVVVGVVDSLDGAEVGFKSAATTCQAIQMPAAPKKTTDANRRFIDVVNMKN
jgi:hypothetical protein